MSRSRRSILYAFGIIVSGLAGRAAIDKLLAAQGGGQAVALWAQLQSVVEMVAGIVGIGIGQGLTVLVAQQADDTRRRDLLRSALVLGGAVGGATALGIAGALAFGWGPVRTWFPADPALGGVAALAGWLSIASGVVSAGWLGRQRQDRVFWLGAALLMAPLVAAATGQPPASMLQAQAAVAGVVAILVLAFLWRKEATSRGSQSAWGASFAQPACSAGTARRAAKPLPPRPRGMQGLGAARRRCVVFFGSFGPRAFAPGGIGRPLLAYVPVGLAISLASPLAVILVRGEISAVMSWHDAGRLQAIWRSADWVTAILSGLLATVVLPRLSAAVNEGEAAFRRVLRAAAWRIVLPAALLLIALWFNQRAVLVALYDARFEVPGGIVGLFFAGEFLRVCSWVILFALLARRATLWVALGEFLSMPMFSALVLAFSDGMTLERAGWLYLLTYLVYLVFNLAGLQRIRTHRVL